MSDERKKYDIVGTVSIGTDEYRDLIEAMKDAEKNADEYRSRYWKEQDTTKSLKEQVEKLQKKVDLWNGFLADHTAICEDWNRYLASKYTGEE